MVCVVARGTAGNTSEDLSVTLTSDHLILLGGSSGTFVHAGALRAGDLVVGSAGQPLAVVEVTAVGPLRMATVLTRHDTVVVEGVVCSSHDGSHRLGYWENMDLRLLSMVVPSSVMDHWAVIGYAQLCDTYIHHYVRKALGLVKVRQDLYAAVTQRVRIVSRLL
jgi:hypothetical protein